jgi:nitrogen regulation protein NR(I)
MKNDILLVEDDASLAASLEQVLSLTGYNVTVATDGEAGLERARARSFAVVVTDFRLPRLSGLELVKQIYAADQRMPIILMTAHGCAELAIEATKLGAYDYLLKPFEMGDLLAMIADGIAQSASFAEPVATCDDQTPSTLVGESGVMQAIYKEIGRVAATSTGVLIQGESGTGKELVARAIWRHSKRAAKPFIAVNCTAIPETLVESEMFGHERGSFTGAEARHVGQFEQAHGGTLFLDEIGDMTLQAQAKLLRVLQERTIRRLGGREAISIDVRVIAATHRDLAAAMREKQFREDLFYRLSVACIRLPPLRDRVEDIPKMVHHFLGLHSAEMGIPTPQIQKEAMEFLQGQPWPGNVRELENVVRRALLVRPGYPIRPSDVHCAMAFGVRATAKQEMSLATLVRENLDRAARGESVGVYAEMLGIMERELFLEAIKLARGNQVQAARWLGISRLTLRHRLRSLGFDGLTLKAQN